MNPQSIMALIVAAGGVFAVVWLLNKIGKALTAILEALATLAAVFLALWMLAKATFWLIKTTTTHWRTTLTLTVVTAWLLWLGWLSLVIVVAVLTVGLAAWRAGDRVSFDPWVGRRLRSWWQRWTIYAPRLPKWLQACGLTIRDHDRPMTLTVNPLGRNKVRRQVKPRADQVPKVLGVRSGPSWDEVRVRLVPGQKPEDFDDAARALASARGVTRCQVRELKPNIVSIDFQRRNLLANVVSAGTLPTWPRSRAPRLTCARCGAAAPSTAPTGTNPLLARTPCTLGSPGQARARRCGARWSRLPRPSETAWCACPGSTPRAWSWPTGGGSSPATRSPAKDALALLDDLIAGADQRKAEFAGWSRSVPITRENPLEIVEFDEIGALIRYIGDRKLREQIAERVALLTTQGRALGYTVRGYVQEPTKDTVPVRELFPRRICLRVATKSHVGMVLGDQAYDRGAWANRIGESEPGVGYLFGEGIREPLRVRGGWVPDQTIKDLETFVTGEPAPTTGGRVLALPVARSNAPSGVA